MAESIISIKDNISILNNICAEVGININFSKCAILPIGKANYNFKNKVLRIDDNKLISFKSRVKYLGVYVTNSHADSVSIDERLNATNAVCGRLRKLLFYKGLKRHTKINILNTFALSTLLYGCCISWNLKNKDRNKLNAWFHNKLRIICNIRKNDRIFKVTPNYQALQILKSYRK